MAWPITGNPTWVDYEVGGTRIWAVNLNAVEQKIQDLYIQPINTQMGAYTLVASDAGKMVEMALSAAADLTVPANVFSAGQRVDVADRGTARMTFVQGVGMTLHGDPSLVSGAQYRAYSIYFWSATEADVYGGLATP